MMDFYSFVYPFNWLVLHLWHPFSRVLGRQNIPARGCMFCVNHASQADPFWMGMALGIRRRMHFMAKKELMGWPVVGAFCRGLGAYGIDRGGSDLAAVKATMTYLKNGDNVVIFPEGTRVKPGRRVEPKNGAILMALRTGVPVVPVYITQRKRPLLPIKIIFGEAYYPQSESKRATAAEMDALTKDLMGRIYGLGEKA